MKQYPAYKDSGIEWIGEIPTEWETIKLKYIVQNFDGRRIPLNSEQRAEMRGGYPYYGSNGIVDHVNDYLFDGEYILLGEDGSPFFEVYKDVAFLVKGKFWVNNHAHILKVFKGHEQRLLTYTLNCVDYRRYITGSTRDKLTQDDMSSIELPIVKYVEQKAIADYLDQKTTQIDGLIAKKERMIELLKEERTAIINQAVTKGLDPKVEMKDSGIEWLGKVPKHWEVKKLKYLVQGKLEYGANEVAELDDQCLPRYIRITDFDDDGNLREDTFKSLSEDKAREYLLNEGDILFARSGATVGKTFQFKNYAGKACFAGYLIQARPNEEILLSDFLCYYTRSNAYENWKNSIFNQATIQNIGADKYSVLPLPLPSVAEQKGIVDFIIAKCKRIDGIISRGQRSLEILKEFRTSLISEVVTGKIDVRNAVNG